MKWNNPGEAWPNWQRNGRRVEIEYGWWWNRKKAAGVLELLDIYTDGGEEYPVWRLICDDGTRLPFAECKRWRFAEAAQ